MGIDKYINVLAKQKDVVLIIVFALILMMIILPLPPFMMDVLITMNLSASILIILISVQSHNPTQFSTFPSLLLVTTLFRLAISISTTRLILLEGDAGAIVSTFGEVVVGGNLVVGLVIFLIITVVQFLVITKGADRVAEVGARFTLDGMPGKQMSVDADVRAGNIDQVDAREARQNLDREAKLFGAMDGAMKFVKGDAIASIVIAAINFLGGITIGMAQRGLSFSDSLHHYSLLTVGDGLVAQIPALLISMAAGNLVTRVASPKGMDLGTEIGQQMLANSRTIIIAGLLISLFGFIPGFPTLVFMIIGSVLSGGVMLTAKRQMDVNKATENDWLLKQKSLEQQWADFELRSGLKETFKIRLPKTVTSIDVSFFCNMIDIIRNTLETEYGMPFSYWKFEIHEEDNDTYQIFIGQELMATGQLKMDTVFVKANPSYLSILDIPCVTSFGIREGAFIDQSYINKLDEENIKYWSPIEQFFVHVQTTIGLNLDALATVQNVSNLLNTIKPSNSVLVNDLSESLSNNKIGDILRLLLRERIPVTHNVRILEAILHWSQSQTDPEHILQKVRVTLGEFITKRFSHDGFLPVVVAAPTVESCIREGMRETEQGRFLIVEPSISAFIAKQIKKIVGDGFIRGHHPVVITQQDVRSALHTIIHEHGVYIPVLAYQEITPETIIYPVDYLAVDSNNETI